MKELKFLSNKELQKLGRTSLALVLAGTFTFSTSLASAAENTDETDQYETVELPDNLDVPKENLQDQAKGEKVEDDTPSLLPGSFFYFAKIALEKIKLAFTFNQEKEAKLLATFAAERLAEAEALFKEGKEDEALEAIKNAFESLENVESIIGEEESVDHAADTEAKTENDVSTENELKTDVASEDSEAEEDTGVDKLLTQNIIALTAAMEKVKNPKAKAALQKNIEKSYAKLASKIEKMEKKDKNKDDEAIEEITSSTSLQVDKNLTENTPAEENAVVKEEVTTIDKEDKAVQVKQNSQEKAVQKQKKKAAHEEAKIQKALIKEEGKNTHKIEKQEKKENKQALKEVKKLEKEMGKDKGKHKENAQKEQGKKGNH